MLTPPSQPPSSASGIQIGDVDGNLNVTVGRDWVGRDKIVNITKTTTIQISVEAVTQKPLVTASPYRGLDRFEDRDKDLFFWARSASQEPACPDRCRDTFRTVLRPKKSSLFSCSKRSKRR